MLGRTFDVQTYLGQVAGLQAQIDSAQYNLVETTVRAPADGYVTNLALRPGTRAANFPIFTAMVFIDTSEILLGGDVQQIYARYIEPGQEAEVTFKTHPGKVFSAKVEYLIPVTSQGQSQLSSSAFQAGAVQASPFIVRLRLDDKELQDSLLPGTAGTFAIYTSKVKMAHVIRRVMIRTTAIMNYVMPV